MVRDIDTLIRSYEEKVYQEKYSDEYDQERKKLYKKILFTAVMILVLMFLFFHGLGDFLVTVGSSELKVYCPYLLLSILSFILIVFSIGRFYKIGSEINSINNKSNFYSRKKEERLKNTRDLLLIEFQICTTNDAEKIKEIITILTLRRDETDPSKKYHTIIDALSIIASFFLGIFANKSFDLIEKVINRLASENNTEVLLKSMLQVLEGMNALLIVMFIAAIIMIIIFVYAVRIEVPDILRYCNKDYKILNSLIDDLNDILVF